MNDWKKYFKITDLEELRNNIKNMVQWHKTKDGQVIHITQLTERHLSNLIRWYETKRTTMLLEPPSVNTHAWDDWSEMSHVYVALKDKSVTHSIKYNMLIKERKKRNELVRK